MRLVKLMVSYIFPLIFIYNSHIYYFTHFDDNLVIVKDVLQNIYTHLHMTHIVGD